MYVRFHTKSLFLSSFNQKLNVSTHYSKHPLPVYNFTNIIAVGGKSTDRRTDMTDLIFAFRSWLMEARKKSVSFATHRQDSQHTTSSGPVDINRIL
jgi:hypothetical protein